ncbi:MAG: GTP cyclohydrolase II [Gammaproteobacteria bacterium]
MTPMTHDSNYINGEPGVLVLDRALGELRRGRAIALHDAGTCYIAAAAEVLRQPLLERMRATGADCRVILTPQRAAALGLHSDDESAIAVALSQSWDAADLRALAGATSPVPVIDAAPIALPAAEQAAVESALRLAKAGRQLPALVWLRHRPDESLVSIDLDAIATDAAIFASHRLRRVSEARVPLAQSVDSRLVMFRDEYTLGEHVAIIVGSPDATKAVAVRLHSACLTGDLLGSLRCDCGEQLRTAVARIAELGGGVLLYLDQEGRGIGLSNKLRAYALQDEGLDTLDADQHLGFLADERNYRVASIMLKELGFEHVELLTNNPQKIQALREHGIDVTGRRPLIAATTEHNERYLRAKRERAGHLAEESGS